LTRSKPGKYLLLATLAAVGVALVFPFTPLGEILGFVKLPMRFLLLMGLIIGLYIFFAEIVKNIFYRKVNY